MLNCAAEINSYTNENYRLGNSGCCTVRQYRSAFCPAPTVDLQQAVVPSVQHYLEQIIPMLPSNVYMSMIQTPDNQLLVVLQEQQTISNECASINQQYQTDPSTVPLTIINSQEDQTSKETFHSLSSSTNINLTEQSTSNKTKVTTNESISVTDDSEIKTTTSFIYDLKKYKYDKFLSKLSYTSNHDYVKFGAPTGICTLTDDRLLVGNFDHHSLLLIDINGIVDKIYEDLPTPKDVRYYSSNPSQAIVATRKEVIILDLDTSQVVVKSQLKGFYPWNVQYIKEQNTIAACDPAGERIVFFDKDLAYIGDWSFNNKKQQALCQSQSQTYNKVYPYAAHFLPDNTSFVLTCCNDKFQIEKLDFSRNTSDVIWNISPTLKSYSIYVDSTRKCIIPDKVNHCLVSIDKDSIIEQYTFKSIREPHSMTFLSTGTLCVTDYNTSYGTNGGIAIISEIDLKANQ
ncbi:unnamed protein product [Rotaria sp. Silwood1]|nr:unnamed protein product [Rotaria sp. Silwood1]CAF3355923.1 unnamed protein product [Rotaria sp. Silwood1]CAF3382871.1 unnamed protein product [Rotaria sp. Silwood1]CAF3387503.1 unnamed protein product [Rotaria sp. Silwood1]CAF4526825.1 unnamed protein product [Rotaria sp. Silwood1]